jgi:hypothetical protein
MMSPSINLKASLSALLAATLAVAAGPAAAQYVADGYTYTEVAPTGSNPLLFGVAAFKICQIKTFLFAGVYILGAIAFVIFAIRALFTKFEMKQFIPILAALFIVASADLFIAFMASDAFYCPTVLASF